MAKKEKTPQADKPKRTVGQKIRRVLKWFFLILFTLVALVVIDSPQNGHLGGAVAGPVFRRIMAGALSHLRVPAERDHDSHAAPPNAEAPGPEPPAVTPGSCTR